MIAPRPERLLLDQLPSPLGDLYLATDERGVLRALWFAADDDGARRLLRARYDAIPLAPGVAPDLIRRALVAYFEGELVALARIPWAAAGTEFQQRVWTALTAIPAGATMTYGALAAGIGRPKAVRAVGAANGANPISVVVPCHRLVGATGALTGYGGGLERKRWLLAHEGVSLPVLAPSR